MTPASTARPRADASLLAALTAAAPARVTKRLDAAPTLANAWTWSDLGATTTVLTDTNETVTLRHAGGAVATLDDIGCTCLLAPRCLHVLAVVAVLDLFVGDRN